MNSVMPTPSPALPLAGGGSTVKLRMGVRQSISPQSPTARHPNCSTHHCSKNAQPASPVHTKNCFSVRHTQAVPDVGHHQVRSLFFVQQTQSRQCISLWDADGESGILQVASLAMPAKANARRRSCHCAATALLLSSPDLFFCAPSGLYPHPNLPPARSTPWL